MTHDRPVARRYWYVLERKIVGQWTIVDASVTLLLSKEEAAWVNESCKPDYRWKSYTIE